MDSAGAVYSRASSHIFGNWNACGKVMGMAPWMGHVWEDKRGEEITAPKLKREILSGKLYEDEPDGGLKIDRTYLKNTPFFARNDPDLFNEEGELIRKGRYDFDDNEGDVGGAQEEDAKKRLPTNAALDAISLSHRMQVDLESVLMDFVTYCKDKTNQSNLCLAGTLWSHYVECEY